MIKMRLLIVVICIGITAVAVEDDDEIESLKVLEGENLTISIHIEKWDEDPQILLIRLKGSSMELIAQIICHNGACAHKWRSEVSLKSDGENVTLSLMNVSDNQAGLYEVRKPSSKRHENKIYNVTVYQPPISTISPEKTASALYSKSTAGISAVSVGVILVVLALVVIIGAVIYIYRKYGKAYFDEVSQETDTEAAGGTDPKVILEVT
ncbi:uncharacterized protein [Garra rufa]|uniref:uncharacterized protein n=1 Tax=Garra rufa TaxID=137080 RepID=UPI003CCE84AD